MAYTVHGSSHAAGIDSGAVMDAFRSFVLALDQATAEAGDEGTRFEGSIAGSDWVGDNEHAVNEFSMTANEAREGAIG